MALYWNMGLWVRTVQADLLGNCWPKPSTLASPTCLSGLTTGGTDKEHGAAAENWLGTFGRDQKREEGDDQPPRILCIGFHLGWAMHVPPGRTLNQTMGWTRWLARDKPQKNPVPLKPETVSHMAEQFSWAPLPRCSPPRRPLPIKPLALSARVSPRAVHFWVLDKSPLSCPGRGFYFLHQNPGYLQIALPGPASFWSYCPALRLMGN